MFALRNRHRDSMAVERGVPRAIQKEPRGRLCLFQDQETSFPRALSAQRLSPRWCFLDGECFCISWRAGGGEVQGKASMAAMDSSFPRDDSDTLHVAPRDWYLHLKWRGLAEVATQLREVMSFKASWLTLAGVLSIKLLKLTFPLYRPLKFSKTWWVPILKWGW